MSVRRALALSMSERYVLIAIALVSNMLLARLLTPSEIGIYSVTLAVIGIAHVLRDFGVGNYLIQEKNLTEAHVRTAFGLSLIIGLLLFAALYVVAPFIARFYGESSMLVIMRVVALNFLVLPFCTISLALLRRNMQFKHLMYSTLSATVMGTFVTIVLAYFDYGPVSMAVGAVITNAATGFFAWLARDEHRVLLPSLSEWRRLLNFGGQNVAGSFVTTISMDINDLALGKILGFAPVAIISRAQGLMNLFHRDLMTAIRNVAYPAYAKAHREGQCIEQQHTSSVTAVTVVAWPFYGFVALYPLEIIRLMFGLQWDAAAPLVPVFCIAGAVAATANLVFNAVLAVGRIDLVTKAELVFQPLRAAMIVAAALYYQTLWACAIAYLLAFFIHAPFAYYVKEQCIPTDVLALWRGLTKSFMVAGACLLIPTVIAWHAGFERGEPVYLPIFLLAGIATVVGWVVALAVIRHPLASESLFIRWFGRFQKIIKKPI